MKITKCLELTDEECKAFEDTVLILDRVIDNLMPNESYKNTFYYLVKAMEDGSLPNLIKF